MAQSTHQCRAFPLARVFRFTDPGALFVVPQGRCIRIGALWMHDSVLPGGRVFLHLEVFVVESQKLPALVLVNACSIGLGVYWQ
ncbi:hypothetical protein D3C85_1680690 [compost metagenome]